MKPITHQLIRSLAIVAIFSASAIVTQAQIIFSDNFNAGASPQWGNQVGNWSAAGGVYNALNQSIPDYSALPYMLTDFAVDVDINDVGDGGLWLRSDAAGANGIFLITGGRGWGVGVPNGGRSLYWHIMVNNNYGSILNEVPVGWTPGVSDVHIRVEVVGNTYSCFLNGATTPITTLTTSQFSSGLVGLYDLSSQTFDNFVLSTIPEPSALSLLALGAVSVWFVRARQKPRATLIAGR